MVGPDSIFDFDYVEWDGSYNLPVVNAKDDVLLVCVSDPNDPRWAEVHLHAADKMDRLRLQASFTTKQKSGSRRGQLLTLNAGVVAGLGLKKPITRGQANKKSAEVVKELLDDHDFLRIAGHGSSAFATWQPILYHSYADNKKDLCSHDRTLKWNFRNSIFAATAFNFGPHVVSLDHYDYENRLDGFCAITPLCPSDGRYDYKKGGHLILWDLRLVIEFPPGTTILLPSAIFCHSNVAIGPKERRFSFAQYSSGHLFQYVEQGYRTEEAFWASLNSDEKAEAKARDKKRWRGAIANFTKLTSLTEIVP
ncbi:hypothetical protein Moror_6666 [Moniliophthora roreri MCA 2997]|uniref:Uncharacterized protein n=1 Tax=Moniliophthora roreri (strain MCA 2997) TaxID=1381753 RepID=V2YYM5_MONRO|nr:hypothetical protein Moror_6666 [Moniliophthora roreri MCA 2997]